jgi:hypothetical protein
LIVSAHWLNYREIKKTKTCNINGCSH